MDKNKDRDSKRLRRKRHIRKHVFGTPERPRLTIFKSNKHIYGQIVDDHIGRTLASASTAGKEAAAALSSVGGKTGGKPAAAVIGGLIAQKAISVGIKRIVFDRNGYRFHGRVKELAEAARKGGLEF